MILPSKLKAILWDNDGVLVNTERLFYQVNRDFFREYGIELTPQDFFNWFLVENCGAWHLLELPKEQIRILRDERNQRYNQCLKQASELEICGIGDVLAQLDGRYRMGIVTSSRRDDFYAIHSKLTLLPYFEFVVAEGDYVESKPDPAPYLVGLERLGLAANQCLAIEDSPRGLQSAIAAGIDCVIIKSELTSNYEFCGVSHIVDSHEQLLEAILKIT